MADVNEYVLLLDLKKYIKQGKPSGRDWSSDPP